MQKYLFHPCNLIFHHSVCDSGSNHHRDKIGNLAFGCTYQAFL